VRSDICWFSHIHCPDKKTDLKRNCCIFVGLTVLGYYRRRFKSTAGLGDARVCKVDLPKVRYLCVCFVALQQNSGISVLQVTSIFVLCRLIQGKTTRDDFDAFVI